MLSEMREKQFVLPGRQQVYGGGFHASRGGCVPNNQADTAKGIVNLFIGVWLIDELERRNTLQSSEKFGRMFR